MKSIVDKIRNLILSSLNSPQDFSKGDDYSEPIQAINPFEELRRNTIRKVKQIG